MELPDAPGNFVNVTLPDSVKVGTTIAISLPAALPSAGQGLKSFTEQAVTQASEKWQTMGATEKVIYTGVVGFGTCAILGGGLLVATGGGVLAAAGGYLFRHEAVKEEANKKLQSTAAYVAKKVKPGLAVAGAGIVVLGVLEAQQCQVLPSSHDMFTAMGQVATDAVGTATAFTKDMAPHAASSVLDAPGVFGITKDGPTFRRSGAIDLEAISAASDHSGVPSSSGVTALAKDAAQWVGDQGRLVAGGGDHSDHWLRVADAMDGRHAGGMFDDIIQNLF